MTIRHAELHPLDFLDRADHSWDLPVVILEYLQQHLGIYYVLDSLEIVCCVFDDDLEAVGAVETVVLVNVVVHEGGYALPLVGGQHQHLTYFKTHFVSFLVRFKRGHKACYGSTLVIHKEVPPEGTGLDRRGGFDEKGEQGLDKEVLLVEAFVGEAHLAHLQLLGLEAGASERFAWQLKGSLCPEHFL